MQEFYYQKESSTGPGERMNRDYQHQWYKGKLLSIEDHSWY